jgi:hypothetical protein
LRLGGFARLIFFFFSSHKGAIGATPSRYASGQALDKGVRGISSRKAHRGGQDAEKSQNDQPTNLAAFYQLL